VRISYVDTVVDCTYTRGETGMLLTIYSTLID